KQILSFLLVTTLMAAPEPLEPKRPQPEEGPPFREREGRGFLKEAFGERGQRHEKEEGEMRSKLSQLASLPKESIKAELEKWPRYQQMTLGEQGHLLTRIQELKDRQRMMAQ